MATASPISMAATGPSWMASQRQAARYSTLRETNTRLESQAPFAASQSQQHYGQQQYHDDDSEDDIPVPMKLSALTKALLDDDVPAVHKSVSRPLSIRRIGTLDHSNNNHSNDGSPLDPASQNRRYLQTRSERPLEGIDAEKGIKGPREGSSPVRRRVVRLGSNPSSVNQMASGSSRPASTSGTAGQKVAVSFSTWDSRTEEEEERPKHSPRASPQDVNTPPHHERIVRIATSSSTSRSRHGSSRLSLGRTNSERSMADRSNVEAADYDHAESVVRNPGSHGSGTQYPSTRGRPEELNMHGSMRVKRVGKLSGAFLSGPARRGRRRQSDEEDERNVDGEQPDAAIQEAEAHQRPREGVDEPISHNESHHQINPRSSPVGSTALRASQRSYESGVQVPESRWSKRSSGGVHFEALRDEHIDVPEALLPKRMELPSAHDQENEHLIAASAKRIVHVSDDSGLGKPIARPLCADVGSVKPTSPERLPLAPVVNNTPHRYAPPPPPKMSVLDAATSAAGAATTSQGKQRRNILRVNGKSYTRLDCLGRGGSAKVYRVTAENGKMLALKRVSLENADESIIRGCRGEIDLLGQLRDVERVINLYDHEFNAEKRILTLVMEIGELDLHKLLMSRQNQENAKFDIVSVRFYWKEMLECLAAVHQHDIVHSDLKPANFVLVHGRLKLIDFGIANAIQTDETVNVHRDTQIGTPSYMSPESIIDANNPSGGIRGGRVPGRPKLVKLGKPSDIWSLGCILYQMVYGISPFGHIPNPLARYQAIINWNHAIDFPAHAVGGVPVPPSLLRTMKRCLNRDTHMRPTCEELLHQTDPFLYPVELNDKVLPLDEEMLGRIVQSVIARCQERIPTELESASEWPQAYWTSIQKAIASRM